MKKETWWVSLFGYFFFYVRALSKYNRWVLHKDGTPEKEREECGREKIETRTRALLFSSLSALLLLLRG